MHNLLHDTWGKGPKLRKRKDQGESEEKKEFGKMGEKGIKLDVYV